MKIERNGRRQGQGTTGSGKVVREAGEALKKSHGKGTWGDPGACARLGGVLGTIQADADYVGDEASTGVTVSGRVIFVGTVPKKAKTLPVHRDSQFCGKTMPNESLLADQK
ncbi:MAG: hypothetical protein ACREJ6_07255 [Candidatus Methylomirabilis sp.]